MHELINKSTNNYVTLLPFENGTNLNNKGWIYKKLKYCVHILMRMRKTASYAWQLFAIKKLAVLMHQTNVSLICLHIIIEFEKVLYLVRFMLINVNENFFVGLLIQLK